MLNNIFAKSYFECVSNVTNTVVPRYSEPPYSEYSI